MTSTGNTVITIVMRHEEKSAGILAATWDEGTSSFNQLDGTIWEADS